MNRRIVVVGNDMACRAYLRVLRREGYGMLACRGDAAMKLLIRCSLKEVGGWMSATGTTALALLHELQSHADLAAIPVVM